MLKYDEVMNEQRKVIYRRRQQILDGGELRDEAIEAIAATVERAVLDATAHRVPRGVGPRRARSSDARRSTRPRDHARAARRRRGTATRSSSSSSTTRSISTRRRRQAVGADNLREIERRVMLSMIDQHWREHLYEMDYLREGINLRAMGQKDPLAEWQREGFDMFEAMMGLIQDNFVQYVSHVQVATVADAPRRAVDEGHEVHLRRRLRAGRGRAARHRREHAARGAHGRLRCRRRGADGERRAAEEVVQVPVRGEKTPGRNEPCYCGSGKKFKLCHGR